jgi:hypothetical protein
MRDRTQTCLLASLVIAGILMAASACGYLAGRVPAGDPSNTPEGASQALEIVLDVFEAELGTRPAVVSVTWVFEDQCERGSPSIKWGTVCLAGLNLDCDLYVAAKLPISGSALVHEVAHCAGYNDHDSEVDDSGIYEPVISKAREALRTEGM